VPILLDAAKTDPKSMGTAAVSALGDIKTPKARRVLLICSRERRARPAAG
jgi:hypothetical protein